MIMPASRAFSLYEGSKLEVVIQVQVDLDKRGMLNDDEQNMAVIYI
jgi:hypothetical protein